MKKNYTLLLLLLSLTFSYSQMRDVTFSVDMSNHSDAFTTVYVSGSFNGWSGTSNALVDNGNGIWSATIPLSDGTYDYKFSLDDWSGQENFTQGATCTTTNGGFTNRFLNVDGSDITLSTPDYSVCAEDSDGIDGPHNITFILDMSSYTGSGVLPAINGTFNSWCGACNSMNDDGNGMWSLTLPLNEESIEFKFTVDGWNDQEFFTDGDDFTVTNGGNVNRFLLVDGEKTVSYVWQQPEALSTNTEIKDEFKVYPNPTSNFWNISSNTNLNNIEIYNVMGRLVFRKNLNNTTLRIQTNTFNTGIYLAKLKTDNGTTTIKLIKN